LDKRTVQILGIVLIIIALIIGIYEHTLTPPHNLYVYGLAGVIGIIGIILLILPYITKREPSKPQQEPSKPKQT
jgi:uncharacterized membrane protein